MNVLRNVLTGCPGFLFTDASSPIKGLVLSWIALSECFPSSLQINQQPLLWNNEDSQNRARRGRPMSEHGLKGCFVAPSQRPSSWFHWNTSRAAHLFQKPASWLWSCRKHADLHASLSHPSCFLFSLLQTSPRKGHPLPCHHQGAIPPHQRLLQCQRAISCPYWRFN